MPRPYLGVKSIHIKVHPVSHAEMKELARLRQKDMAQEYRDAVNERLARMRSCLQPLKPSSTVSPS